MRYFLLFTINILVLGSSFSQNEVLDSLLLHYRTTNLENLEKVKLQNRIAWEFNMVDSDSSRHYAILALELAEKIKDYPGQARALNLIAIYFSTKNQVDSSISYNEKALSLSLEHDFLEHRSAILNDLGGDFGRKGLYEQQLQYYYAALEVGESLKNEFQSYTLGNIASTHWDMGNEKQANHYHQRALEEAAQSSDKYVIHNLLDNKGHHLFQLDQLDSSLVYFEKAFQIAEREQMKIEAAWDLLSIANSYLYKEEYDQTIQYLDELYENYMETGAANMLFQYYGLSSAAYKGKKQYDLALSYRLKCKEEIEKSERVDFLPHIYEELSEIYAFQKDYKNAYTNLLEFSNLKDSLSSEEKDKAILEMEAKYQNQKKEQDNLLLKENQEVLKRYNNLLFLAIIFLVLFASVTTMLLLMRNRSTKILRTKNQELKILNTELHLAKQEALDASKTKQDFLSRMSHEIRTPLNAVIGFANILLNEKPRLEQLPYLHHLKSSGNYLIHLINNLLDYSKIEAGKLKLESNSFDLEKSLIEMVDSFKLNNTNDNLQISLEVDKTLPKQEIIGSPFRLNQVLYNLMSNAVKFTPNGSVVVRAKVDKVAREQIWIRFEVEDTGIGIEKEMHQKIFESFMQAEDSTSQEFGGTGLGLSIVEDLLKMMGSQTEVRSSLDKGSMFSFLLPFRLGKVLEVSNELIARKSKITANYLKDLKILLAEDNLFNQKIATKILENKGVEVTAVKNGQEALNKMEQENFDLVLMDLHMPIMDGYEAVKRIRRMDKDKSEIPIILLSATTLDPFINEIRNIEVDYYIEKPFSPEVLYEAIEKCILDKKTSPLPKKIAVI